MEQGSDPTPILIVRSKAMTVDPEIVEIPYDGATAELSAVVIELTTAAGTVPVFSLAIGARGDAGAQVWKASDTPPAAVEDGRVISFSFEKGEQTIRTGSSFYVRTRDFVGGVLTLRAQGR